VETVLTNLKYKPCQNQAQLRDLSEFMEPIGKKKLIKARPAIKVSPENENVDIEIVEETEDEEPK
jgi:hypothetical protein